MSDARQDAAPRRAAAAIWLVAAVVTVATYGPSAWDAGYVLDDQAAVLDNPLARWPTELEPLLTAPWFGPAPAWRGQGVSRPLVTLSYAIEDGLGLGARGRHLVSLALAILASALLGALAMAIAARWRARRGVDRFDRLALAVGLWTSALFAAHPVHAEAVMAVGYRPELMASALISAALLAALADDWLASVAAFALALLAKESALATLAPLTLLAWWRPPGRGRRAALWAAAAAGLVGAAWLAARLQLVPIGAVSAIDNPLAAASVGERMLGALYLAGHASGRLLAPVALAPDYSFDVLPVLAPPTADLVAGVLVCLAALGALVAALRAVHLAGGPEVAPGAAALALALMTAAAFYGPVSQVPMAATLTTADRVLLLPSMGLCALGGAALGALTATTTASATPKARALAGVVVVLGLVGVGALAAVAMTVAADWRDDLSVHLRGVRLGERSLKMNYNLGRLHLLASDAAGAREALERAWAIRPGDTATGVLLVQAATRLGDCARGEAVVAALLPEAATATQPCCHDAGVCKATMDLRFGCRRFADAFALGRSLPSRDEKWRLDTYVAGVAAGAEASVEADRWIAAQGVDLHDPAVVAAAAWAESHAGRPAAAVRRYAASLRANPDAAAMAMHLRAICDHPKEPDVAAACAEAWRAPERDATDAEPRRRRR